jgi:hypothetical protein
LHFITNISSVNIDADTNWHVSAIIRAGVGHIALGSQSVLTRAESLVAFSSFGLRGSGTLAVSAGGAFEPR